MSEAREPIGKATLKECICVFFAAAPDEEMTIDQMLVKFGFSSINDAYQLTRRLVQRGLLAVRLETESSSSGARKRIFSAGPVLLKLIGRA